MIVNAFILAQRYVGVREFSGAKDHPLVRWWFSLCGMGFEQHDEVPWCSAFVNGIAWELSLPRSKSPAARSWLNVGERISLEDARPGWDVVVLSRGILPQPGLDVLAAPGHVGFFAGYADNSLVRILGGNQSDEVTIDTFSGARVLAVQRLYPVR